jgi:aminopeptidase N
MAPFSGGMEHQTMTSQGFFNFTITAHELAHQWFGDNVTCKTWNDIFLNEGYASYSEYLALEAISGLSAANTEMNSVHTSVMSSPGGSVYNPDTVSVSRIFSSRLSYDKGAAVLHTLRYLTGDSLFFAICKTYQQIYKDGNASIADFKSIAENVSQMNLNEFFTQWIYGEGFPTFNVEWNQLGNTFAFNSAQTVSMPSVTPLFTTPMMLRLNRSIGDTTIIFSHNSNNFSQIINVSGTVTSVVLDPSNYVVNAGSVTKNTGLLSSVSENSFHKEFAVYPGVIKSGEIIYFNTEVNETVYIFSSDGKLVHRATIQNARELSLPNMASGNYILQIAGTNQKAKFSVIK